AGADAGGEERLAQDLVAALPAVAGLPRTLRDHIAGVLLDALFTNGRIDLAAQSVRALFGDDWSTVPLEAAANAAALPSLPFMPVRLLFYAGRTGEAEALLHRVRRLPSVVQDPVWSALADALLTLCAAARGETARARSSARAVAAAFPRPDGYLDSSARAVSAHGLAVLGDLTAAAGEIRTAGGPGLSRLMIIDRALGFEILVREALQRHDRTVAAEAARDLLEVESHPAAGEIALRVFALLDLADGAAESARRRSEAALARARIAGVMRHAAEGELLHCRALIGLGQRTEAVDGLQRAASSAAARGDTAEQRDAARELRQLGRRVIPTRGSGWAGLGRREREVAVLAAQGFSNRAIGDALFLSPRSVSGLVRRVLAAFDVTRRAALATRIHPHLDGSRAASAPEFSPRQREVIALIARGATNAEIAEALGISPRTVERHVAAALAASGASSRTQLVHLALSQDPQTEPATAAASTAPAD
ncbi:MAG: helix-turn-helix domain-containing protein, partial [Actinobacteria bacterium]|nr:helix-turn-helix domain-containing protein [Actinomycetota bacterium]